MSRKAFHDSGISQHLRFPKRAAIHNELPTASWKAEVVHQPKSSEEMSFIAAAVRRNTNLRALLHMTEEQLSLLTASAERMEVKKNEEVALFGEVGDKFFIIREGTFEVVLGPWVLCSNYGPFGRTTSFLTDSRQEDLPSNFFSRHVSGPSEALRPTLTSPLLPRRNRTRGGGMTQSVTLGGGFGQIGRIQESEAGQESGEESYGGTERLLARENCLESADSTPPTSHDILVKGDSFGELALLYNMRREATFRAREASVVYAVPRRAWESCFTRRGQRFDEYCKLLDEVHALEPLLSSERFELACNASGGGYCTIYVAAVAMEWKVLKERCFAGEPIDPVFEGIVKDFISFDVTLQDVSKKVDIFMRGIDTLAEGLASLAESTTVGLAAVDDPMIKADCFKMKEATNAITRGDAPHSAIAKLRRDMNFNVVNPLKCHIVNHKNMKGELDKRRRRLLEYNIAKREIPVFSC
eukprot:symbB.v1.2.003250.t1/scaffold180.1/size283405/9